MKNISLNRDNVTITLIINVINKYPYINAHLLKTVEEAIDKIKKVENAFHFYDIWHVLIKYVTPVALFIVLLYTTGALSFF